MLQRSHASLEGVQALLKLFESTYQLLPSLRPGHLPRRLLDLVQLRHHIHNVIGVEHTWHGVPFDPTRVRPPVGTLGEELVGVREVTCMVRNASLTNHMVGSRPARIP